MKKISLFSLGFLSFLAFNINAALTPQNGSHSLAPMLNKVMPAVVNISVRGQLQPIQIPVGPGINGQNAPQVKLTPRFEGVGSGVVVDAEQGYILTNAHVVQDAKIIVVTLNDGRRLQGKVLGSDDQVDIAVVKINARHLTAIPFGDSDDLNVGDFVAAIGNPFGLSQTVTSGVISALGRGDLGIEGYEDFIQTDAPINPGNSGGALVNMQGKLIAINTAIITPNPVSGGSVGIGLAIPSNMCKSVMEQVIKFGRVEHGLLGVMVQKISPALADALHLKSTQGALVSQVNPGTPAEKAGLKSKDIIVELNGKPIKNAFQVSTTIGLLRPGTEVTLKVISNGEEKSIKTTISSLRKETALMEQQQKPLLADLALRNFDQLESGKQVTGVEIYDVDDFSIAYSCGLRPGDVILAANEQNIANIDQLKQMAEKYPNSLLLKIKREGEGTAYLVLEK